MFGVLQFKPVPPQQSGTRHRPQLAPTIDLYRLLLPRLSPAHPLTVYSAGSSVCTFIRHVVASW